MESARVRESLALSFGEASQAFPLPFGSVLRRARKHFDQKIVQAVEKLPLESPFELRMVEVARMQLEVVRVHGNGGVSKLNNDLYVLSLRARVKIKQGMLVQTQLSEHAIKPDLSIHDFDCNETRLADNRELPTRNCDCFALHNFLHLATRLNRHFV